ncbi:adenylate/guanylate cyclase domain-containing protein [Maribacter sp. 2210JD10-5]|uniref:adenylate/guanylate cyclase domain-containing protein n=1 Tax=Maribacter sp. 2210JD10-5 TaxID=3386272 RepID=UPI0039BD3FED
MTFKNKRRLRIIGTYCIGWTLAFIFLTIIRGVGATEDGAIDFDVAISLVYAITIGPLFGAISGYVQILVDERFYKRTSVRKLLMIRLAISIFFLILLIVVSYLIVPPLLNIDITLLTFISDEGSSAIYFYILTVDIFMAALWQVNLMLGENNLWKILMGKFYNPHEENRIFMFLDLKDSTVLAERLGHIKYSRLIQDCFNDLGVVIENEAEIYQYVGDEAVLTWHLKDGLRNLNCINTFYNFKSQLLKRKEYYLKMYGSIPFFKAGLNEGVVTATEVGRYKKDIAYHGDAINTAARIQGKCNELNKELLISKNLLDKFENNSFVFEQLNNIPLKGKTKEVSVFAVSLQTDEA